MARIFNLVGKRNLSRLVMYTSNRDVPGKRMPCGDPMLGLDGKHVTLDNGTILSGGIEKPNKGGWSIDELVEDQNARKLLDTGKLPSYWAKSLAKHTARQASNAPSKKRKRQPMSPPVHNKYNASDGSESSASLSVADESITGKLKSNESWMLKRPD
jgi:hypothetical protein